MPDANPRELLYHPEHGWARIEPPEATFGITAHAADQLGEIMFVDAPAVGVQVRAGDPYGEIESAKTVSDLIAPLSGTVIAVNGALGDAPHVINDDPYGEGWITRVRLSDDERGGTLLDVDAYVATTEE